MKLYQRHSIFRILIEITIYLFILLFVYAATNKLLDFENFRIQLGQSPLLSAFASWVSIAVPLSEFIIVLLLLVPTLRFFGLFAFYFLMVMFTAYIYIILNYSAFVPCSCGGILEKMIWSQHLVFNFCFVLLAGVSILFMPKHYGLNKK